MSALRPRLHEGVYAFVCVPASRDIAGLGVVASIQEPEGKTLVLPEERARAHGLEVIWRGRWITLEVETALSLVGLTARFAGALADAGISCNVIAGAFHDHLFVPVESGERARALLAQLALDSGPTGI